MSDNKNKGNKGSNSSGNQQKPKAQGHYRKVNEQFGDHKGGDNLQKSFIHTKPPVKPKK